ncbi:Collagenase [Thalictrum thalictroides]|uniref:Collagenase n=1 Tax=Thalictrum thalictroides TaxID=46969 RepID=A0A7J6W188_THATH|nr:Collagenase [Thalictrum thalictroides]
MILLNFIQLLDHYTFFPGTPKWTHLTYAIDTTNRDLLAPIFATVFAKWSAVSLFTFEEVADITTSDIKISVHRGDHGDSDPFDGPGGTLAHAFAPSDGRLHFDADESWSTVPLAGYMDLQTVALHEVVHILGLGHSAIEGALMYPTVEAGIRKDIHQDDIDGIHALYT